MCFFWLRGWDLNLTASGLWARRATRLLYPAIWSWCADLTVGAGDRDRTGTILSYHGILSPGRLPVPPHRHSVRGRLNKPFSACLSIVSLFARFVNPFFWKIPTLRKSFLLFLPFDAVFSFPTFIICIYYMLLWCVLIAFFAFLGNLALWHEF